ncbi:MAG: hypothetical protein HY720_25015 [Planctomycetes bacterium]|nr:hypothetical protein [Planctomycetota bacterium]
MPVVFKCDCGKYLSVRSKYIGKKIKCPVCGEVNKVPDPLEKKAKQLRRLETKALETEKFRRLKDAVDEDRDIALEEKELMELELPGSGENSRWGEDEEDEKRPEPEPRPLERASATPDKPRSEHRTKEKAEHRAKEKSASRVKDKSESRVKDRSESRVKDRDEPRESHGEKPERKERPEHREKSEHREKPREKAHEKASVPKGGVEIQCFCGKKHAVGPEKKGKSFTCDACGRVVHVPGGKMEELELVPLEAGEPCPKCGALLKTDEKVCHACGHRLDQRFAGGHGADPGAARKKSKHR